MSQPTLFEFIPSKIKASKPLIDNKATNNPSPSTNPPEINFKSQSNKNNSETEGKLSRRRDREEGPPGLSSSPTSPSPPPSTVKRKKKASSIVVIPPRPDPRNEPRSHPIMQDPEFQMRYKRFLKRNGLEYGTSDPKKSALWLRFWDVELKRWYDREEAQK
jgi:hypothetical protein